MTLKLLEYVQTTRWVKAVEENITSFKNNLAERGGGEGVSENMTLCDSLVKSINRLEGAIL